MAQLRSDGSGGGAGGAQVECGLRSGDSLPVEALLSVLLQLQVPTHSRTLRRMQTVLHWMLPCCVYCMHGTRLWGADAHELLRRAARRWCWMQLSATGWQSHRLTQWQGKLAAQLGLAGARGMLLWVR